MQIRSVLGLALGGFLASCVGDVGSNEQELIYDQVLEGEAMTGAGTVVIDLTASGGQYRSNAVAYTTMSGTFTTTGPIQGVTLRAKQTGTCMPLADVRMDGISFASERIDTTSWDDYPLGGSFGAGTHTLTIYYRAGLAGCSMDIDKVTFSIFEPDPPPPQTITSLEAELATGAGTVDSDPAASGDQLRTFTQSGTAATLAFTLDDPMVSATVRVRGGLCAPMGRVKVDGVILWAGTVYSSGWTEYPLSPNIGAGSHTVELYARSASASCPLRYDVVTIVSQEPPPPPITTVIEAESAVGAGAV
jgi:hypothetical protein